MTPQYDAVHLFEVRCLISSTQENLAKKYGIPISTYRDWESARSQGLAFRLFIQILKRDYPENFAYVADKIRNTNGIN